MHFLQRLFRRPRSPQEIDGLITQLKSHDVNVATKAARALSKAGDSRAVEPLVRALEHPTYVNRGNAAAAPVREAAEEALVALGDVGVEALIRALRRNQQGKDWVVRNSAAKILGRIGDPNAIDALIDATDDPDSIVRQQVGTALTAFGNLVRERLAARRASGTPADVVQNQVLAADGDDVAIDALISAVTDEREPVRMQAVRSLATVRHGRAIQALANAVDDTNSDIRASAVQALVGVGAAAHPTLVKLLNSAVQSTREHARDAVGDAIRLGGLTLEARNELAAVIKTALKAGWAESGAISLVSLLTQLDQCAGREFMATAQTGDAAAMERLLDRL